MPDWQSRVSAAEAKLRAGCDPELENGQPRRSDEWCLAFGWQDAIGEEAISRYAPCLASQRLSMCSSRRSISAPVTVEPFART